MRPVLWWAAVGGLCFAFELFLLVTWIAGGPERVSPGPTAVPTFMKVNIIIQQAISPIILLGAVWWFLVRPWRREGRISWDGCYIVAAASVIWQDILCNYIQPTAMWNSYFLNWGSWYAHVPGWVSPNPEGMAEAVMMSGFWYPPGLLLAAVLGTFLLRRTKARWPQLGVVGLVAVCFGIFAVVDIIMEVLYLRLGLYVYPTSGERWTVFHGHYYDVGPAVPGPYLVGQLPHLTGVGDVDDVRRGLPAAGDDRRRRFRHLGVGDVDGHHDGAPLTELDGQGAADARPGPVITATRPANDGPGSGPLVRSARWSRIRYPFRRGDVAEGAHPAGHRGRVSFPLEERRPVAGDDPVPRLPPARLRIGRLDVGIDPGRIEPDHHPPGHGAGLLHDGVSHADATPVNSSEMSHSRRAISGSSARRGMVIRFG